MKRWPNRYGRSLTTGRRIDAEEAVDLGIATEVVPDAELDETVHQRVSMLCSRPTRAVGEAKRLLLRNSHRSLETALAAEIRAQKRAVETEDFAEGIQAFVEKREPEFTGR